MAQNIGTLITAAIRPNDSLDLIASAFQNEIKGGLHSYSATTERDALIIERRQEGMLVYVADEQKFYKLNSGLTNSDWVEFSVGTNGNFLSISGGTVTGNTLFSSNLSASTIYLGSENIYDLINTAITGDTYVSGGTNVVVTQSGNVTGGTTFTVNVTGLTSNPISLDYSTFKSLSGSFITQQIYNVADSTDVFGYGTDYAFKLQTLSPVDSFPSGIELSGANYSNRLIQINLNNDKIVYFEDNNSRQFLNKQIESLPVVVSTKLVSGETLSIENDQQSLVYGSYSIQGGDLIVSGSGEFIVFSTEDNNTGGTVSAGNNIEVSGVTVSLQNNISLNSVSANTISGATLYSGSTNLYDIFLTTSDGNDITRVQNGLNTYTGGTGNNPTINVSGLTVNNINVSGISVFNTLSANTNIYLNNLPVSRIFTASTQSIVANVPFYVTHNLGTNFIKPLIYDETDFTEVVVSYTAQTNDLIIESNIGFTASIIIEG